MTILTHAVLRTPLLPTRRPRARAHARTPARLPRTAAPRSVLLIRPRLPPRQRAAIVSALGADVPFRFCEDFNDAVFIAAAAASAAGLLAQHRCARLRAMWARFGRLWALTRARCARAVLFQRPRRFASRAEALAGGGADGGGGGGGSGLSALAAGLRGGGGSASKRATD